MGCRVREPPAQVSGSRHQADSAYSLSRDSFCFPDISPRDAPLTYIAHWRSVVAQKAVASSPEALQEAPVGSLPVACGVSKRVLVYISRA